MRWGEGNVGDASKIQTALYLSLLYKFSFSKALQRWLIQKSCNQYKLSDPSKKLSMTKIFKVKP